jgi:hypothetical protein
MKLLTHNFLNCAAKSCKASPDAFPLKFEQVELTAVEMDYNPQFLINVLPRVDWTALVQTAIEVKWVDDWAKDSLEIRVYHRRNRKICLQRMTSSCSAYFTRYCWRYDLQ